MEQIRLVSIKSQNCSPCQAWAERVKRGVEDGLAAQADTGQLGVARLRRLFES